MAAKDLAKDVEDVPRTVTFGEGDGAITLTVPAKWKRFKFLRCINGGDIYGAIEAVFGLDQAALLDDLETDEDEFGSVLEKLAEGLAGTSAGN
mgnify:CR=1 FL=1